MARRSKRRARLRSSLPPQLWRNVARDQRAGHIGNTEEDHVDYEDDDDERASSNTSLDSNCTDANIGDFSANMVDLIDRN